MPEPIAYESLPYLHPLEVVRELGGFDEEGEEDEATQKLPQNNEPHVTTLF